MMSVLSACSNRTNAPLPANGGGLEASTSRRPSVGPLAIGHVYFSNSAVVKEYPIVHGIAASKPDKILQLPPVASGEVFQLMDIAIDPNGNLAVLTATHKTWNVYTNKLLRYAPGSRGNDPPSSVLNLPGGKGVNAFTITFDPKANVYVGMGYGSGKWGYNVYASGSAGSAAPRATFHLSLGAVPIAFLGDTMYVSGGDPSSITAYANAASHPVASNSWCLTPGSWVMGGGFGLDPRSKRMFAPEWLVGSHKDTSRIAIYPLNTSACPRTPIDSNAEHVSPTPNGRFDPTEAWYNDNYIFVGDAANNVTYEVPAKAGAHAPIVTLPGIGAMAFGP
jgi:hypothetical protein